MNPKRIAIAGKIRVFCFDKTGTLTHEGLDFIGAQSVIRSGKGGSPIFGHLDLPANGDGIDPRTLHGLATCHAVTKFGDQFVGNQVEVSLQIPRAAYSPHKMCIMAMFSDLKILVCVHTTDHLIVIYA